MVEMDEYFFHPDYLVCGAARELRRLCRERLEGRLRRILEQIRTPSSALYIETLSSLLLINATIADVFKCFPSIQHHFRLRPRNTPSSISEPFASLLPISPRSQ